MIPPPKHEKHSGKIRFCGSHIQNILSKYIYIYIYIYRERERERDRGGREGERECAG